MLRRAAVRRFYHQRDTPIIPQVPVNPVDFAAQVGYLLVRNQIVKPDLHPLEVELANMLDREHQRYARHPNETATHYFASRELALDANGRMDAKVIEADFFVNEGYTEALKTTLSRYTVPKRAQPQDRVNLFDPALDSGPPTRHTLNRHLGDFLVLIVQDRASGKWTVPHASRRPKETMRMTLDRTVADHHGGLFSTYCFSNAPASVLTPTDAPTLKEPLYVFPTVYLGGRPKFSGIEPAVSDHAWVRRSELDEYEFLHDGLGDLLFDIAVTSELYE